ncbi:MAG: sugar nucleotide-binding protein, partial [Aggregatilineales bacterium]
ANPTYTSDLADAVVQVIDKDLDGMLHLVNDGAASRYEFGRYALNQAGYTDTPIEKIKLSDWERASTPPQNAGLENRVAASHGITLRPWQDAVDAFLQHEGLLQESVE